MNVTLFSLVWCGLAMGAAVWWSPRASMWLSVLLRARSLALEEARRVYRARFQEVRDAAE